MYDYSRFIAKVRENAQRGLSDSEAIENAVAEAIKGNLLDGFVYRDVKVFTFFLPAKKCEPSQASKNFQASDSLLEEVIGMILEEFDEEIYK